MSGDPALEHMRQRALAKSTTIAEFKQNLRAEYRDRYGSAAIDLPDRVIVNPMIAKPPRTARAVEQQRNAMAFGDGRYPVGISDCYVVGISGGCGGQCPVLLSGRCDSEEMHKVLAFGPVPLEAKP